jgi:hypothetical protein
VIWDQRHLMTVPREYEEFCSTHWPHRTLPHGVTGLDHSASGGATAPEA